MLAPGLYELDCKACGAPINPPAESTVVRCEHCGQPHVWVAPSSGTDRGQWVVKQSAPVRKLPVGALVVLGGVVVLILVLGAAGAVFMRSSPRSAAEGTVTADVPLAMGDSVTYYKTPNSSCSGFVSGVAPNGRVLIGACGDDALDVDRSVLKLQTYSYQAPEPDDVALEHTAAGWSRVIVLGTDAGKRVRVEPLLGGAAHSADDAALLAVRPRNQSGSIRWVAIPSDVALETGDVVNYHDGSMLRTAEITRIDGTDAELLNGYSDNGVFEADKTVVPARRGRSTLLAELASPFSPPAGDRVLLARNAGKWQRAALVSTGEHGRWTLRAQGASDTFVAWGGEVLTLSHAAGAK